MLKYIVAKSKDPDYKTIFQRALEVSAQRIVEMEKIFQSAYHPIPVAFGEKDVEINAKELFSESYFLSYTRLTNKYILMNYSKAFSMSTRTDIQAFLVNV